jgi:3-phenylpropionate/trans-cinnamate dioxygenase ferredoxin reductase subunit
MAKDSFKYIIVGAGLAGASAIEGIREVDKTGAILLVGLEANPPYNRPPLSKTLWLGKENVSDTFIHNQNYYDANNVSVLLKTKITAIELASKKVCSDDGKWYNYEKLLLATGGEPRRLSIPGGNLDGISYYRDLNDYSSLSKKIKAQMSVLIVGGGFIASEMAAALSANKVKVTLIFPDKYLVQRVFPDGLAQDTQNKFIRHGIQVLSEDLPVSIEATTTGYSTQTRSGKKIKSDRIIVGIGIDPAVGIAESAGLKVENGITVDQYLQTSHEGIFAAGDNANFPYLVLNKRMRIEHWDNASNQGKLAGRNMAGAHEIYDYMPYFFSDLFDIGYEAVGEVDARLETVCDWEEENNKGIIYYLKGSCVRGVMMCNFWDKVDWARALIRKREGMPAVYRRRSTQSQSLSEANR